MSTNLQLIDFELIENFQSSQPNQKQPLKVFCKKKWNFAKFTGKHLYQSLFLIKLQVGARNFGRHLWATAPAQFPEIRISDVHLLVLTFMKAKTIFLKPKTILFRHYKHFDE